MARRRKKDEGGPKGVAGWMATYGDMVTLLLCFFVLLFAMSTVDAELFEQMADSFNNSRTSTRAPLADLGNVLPENSDGLLPNIVEPPPTGPEGDEGGVGDVEPVFEGGREHEGDTIGTLHNTFATYLAETVGDNSPFDVEVGEDYILIDIDERDGVFFNSGQARLTRSAEGILDILGPELKRFSELGHGIIIEGHTDDRPIANAHFPSNWTLSGARASSVVEYLVNNFEIDVHMIAGLGLGEHFPKASNETVEGRAQNRRVDIKIFTTEMTASGAIRGWFSIPGT